MSCSLDSLKRGYLGIIYGSITELMKGDTRILDFGSCG